MTLKPCPNCARPLTTKQCTILGRQKFKHAELLLLNCKHCNGTLAIKSKTGGK